MMNVRFRVDGVDHKATSTDVGRGGAFFASRSLPAVGTRIEIAVLGPAGDSAVARTLAEVVRVVEASGGPTEVRGFAVRWLPADQARKAVSVDDLVPAPGKP